MLKSWCTSRLATTTSHHAEAAVGAAGHASAHHAVHLHAADELSRAHGRVHFAYAALFQHQFIVAEAPAHQRKRPVDGRGLLQQLHNLGVLLLHGRNHSNLHFALYI